MSRQVAFLIIFLLAIISQPALAGTPAEPDSIAIKIRQLERSFGGRIGFMAKNLRSGETIAHAENERFPTASTIKLPILLAYFLEVAAGRLTHSQIAALDSSNKWGGSGVLQSFHGRADIKLIDAAFLMMTVSDNTGTNIIIDALAESHAAKLDVVNTMLAKAGLKNTKLINKVGSWATKTDSVDSIRFGIGASTAADMVTLLEKLYRRELLDSSATDHVLRILGNQHFTNMLPRYLPRSVRVLHKTGGISTTKVDVGLLLHEEAEIAIAVFCDQIQSRQRGAENPATIAAARVAELAWQTLAGDSLAESNAPTKPSINWQHFPSGKWARFFLSSAPFPHASRADGHSYQDNNFPADPHYSDSSVVVVIPNGYDAAASTGNNMLLHFHGWYNDNLSVMQQFDFLPQFIASKSNAILVLAQGPWRAADSGGGKMEDDGGLKRFVAEILTRLAEDNSIKTRGLDKLILSAHSGGYRPLLYALENGGLQNRISALFMFDAFYAAYDKAIPWLKSHPQAQLFSIYTEHLADEHHAFKRLLANQDLGWTDDFTGSSRIILQPTDACHNCVINGTLSSWLEKAGIANTLVNQP